MTTHNNEHKHEAQDIIEEYELGLVEAGLRVNVDIDYDKLAEARQLVWERLEAYIQSQIEEAELRLRIDELERIVFDEYDETDVERFMRVNDDLPLLAVEPKKIDYRIAQLKASKKGKQDARQE